MEHGDMEQEFYKSGAGALMPYDFADHVRSQEGRSIAECLDDPLPVEIKTIRIPDSDDLDERYRRTRSPRPLPEAGAPPTSFAILARTWRELGAATWSFRNVPRDFDIFPNGIVIEGDVALVICDT